MKTCLLLSGIALALGIGMTPASAGSFRTAVSVSGADSGPCVPAAPCRTISYALSQTNAGGEIFILSSGGYGPFTVSQAVTISAPSGIIAAVSAPAGDAVTIATGPSDLVILTGFLLDGQGSGANGIKVNSVGSLAVKESAITGFTTGILFTPNVGGGGAIFSSFANHLFANSVSLIYAPIGGTAGTNNGRAFIKASDFSVGPVVFDGTNAAGDISAQINSSTLRNISGVALGAKSSATAAIKLQVDNSNIYHVSSALYADGASATITIGGSSLSKISTVGTSLNGGSIVSFGDNHMAFYSTLGSVGSRALQ